MNLNIYSCAKLHENRYTCNVPDSVLQQLQPTCAYTWKNKTGHTIAHESSSNIYPVVDHHLRNITLSEPLGEIQYTTDCLPGQTFRFMVFNSTSTTKSSESFESPTPTSEPPDSFPICQVLVPVLLVFLAIVVVFIFVKYGRRLFCSPNCGQKREEVHVKMGTIDQSASNSTPKDQVIDFGSTPLLSNGTAHAANGCSLIMQ